MNKKGTPKNIEPHRWQPGESGNPGGRPKGMAALIRKQTGNGQELVSLWIHIMRGGTIKKDGINHHPTLSDMLKAAQELADRGFGRATQPIDLGDNEVTSAIVEAARAFTERIASLSTKQEKGTPALKPES